MAQMMLVVAALLVSLQLCAASESFVEPGGKLLLLADAPGPVGTTAPPPVVTAPPPAPVPSPTAAVPSPASSPAPGVSSPAASPPAPPTLAPGTGGGVAAGAPGPGGSPGSAAFALPSAKSLALASVAGALFFLY